MGSSLFHPLQLTVWASVWVLPPLTLFLSGVVCTSSAEYSEAPCGLVYKRERAVASFFSGGGRRVRNNIHDGLIVVCASVRLVTPRDLLRCCQFPPSRISHFCDEGYLAPLSPFSF